MRKKFYIDGKLHTIKTLAEEAGISEGCLRNRISRNKKLPRNKQLSIKELAFNYKKKNGLYYNGNEVDVSNIPQHYRRKLRKDQKMLERYMRFGEAGLKERGICVRKGKLYDLQKLYKEYNIPKQTLTHRLINYPDNDVMDLILHFDKIDARFSKNVPELKRTGKRLVTFNGKKMHIEEAAKKVGVTKNTLYRYFKAADNDFSIDVLDILNYKTKAYDTHCACKIT